MLRGKLHAMYRGPRKVISSGQEGVEIAALRAARNWFIETGGFTTPGLSCDEGLDGFGLTEIVNSAGFITPRQMNVNASDATIAFMDYVNPGVASTIVYATHGEWRSTPIPRQFVPAAEVPCVAIGSKPVLRVRFVHWRSHREAAIEPICAFLRKYRVQTLNVCASSKITSLDFESNVENVFSAVFTELHHAPDWTSEASE